MARIRRGLFDHRGSRTLLALLIVHTDLSAQNAAGDIEVDTIIASVNDDEANAANAQDSASALIGFGIFGDGFE